MTAALHAFVPTTCDTCHEAGLSFYLGASTPPLQGRPADHMAPTGTPQQQTGDCSGCHNTTNWSSTALPAGHMPNPGNQQCTTCHTAAPGSYVTLASNAVLHTGISSGCAQCHGGSTALTFYNNNDNPKSAVLSPPHIPAFTGTDCSSCHSSTTYATGGFGPMNMTQATHAGVGSTCNPCHEAGLSFYMGAANPGLQGRPADHTAGQQASPNDCNLCHTTANWNTTVLPAGHMPNPANQACNVCHTTAPTNYATMASVAVLHTGITGGCSQCHGGSTQLTFYNNNDNPKAGVLTPPHIPYLSGTDCSSCHAKNFVVGGFGPMNMSQATHAFVATTCVSCHEAGSSFYMGAASPALQGRPADHTSGQMVAPNDCSLCHTTANWNSTALPAGHMPNPANQGCSVCHTAAPTNYATLAANTVLHTGISSGCITCHGAPNAAAPVFYLNYTPKDALLSPVHIPTAATPCEKCHAISFTSFSGTSMSSAKHTAMFAYIGEHLRRVPRVGQGFLRRHQPDHTAERPSCRPGLQRLSQHEQLGRGRRDPPRHHQDRGSQHREHGGGGAGECGRSDCSTGAGLRGARRTRRGARRDHARRRRFAAALARRRPRQLRVVPQRHARGGQAGVARQEQQHLRELPYHHCMAAGPIRASGSIGCLCRLPQRRAGHGQAGQARADDQGLRGLPRRHRLEPGDVRPPRCQCGLRRLSQRRHGDRQAAATFDHDARLQLLSRHPQLGKHLRAARAASFHQAGAARRESDQVIGRAE